MRCPCNRTNTNHKKTVYYKVVCIDVPDGFVASQGTFLDSLWDGEGEVWQNLNKEFFLFITTCVVVVPIDQSFTVLGTVQTPNK